MRYRLIMVAQHACSGEIPDDFQTLVGICIVSHHVSEAMELGTTILTSIGKDGLQSLQVGMDIAEDRHSHSAGG